jgi:DNA-binding winged helix-turn-helix (wHTH) protein
MTEELSFRLDPADRTLWRGAERVDLAPKTCEVLRYLIDNAGRLITHEELLSALWSNAPVQQEVLKSHILAIRNVLGDRAAAPRFIETVRGRGYRFIGPLSAFGLTSGAAETAAPGEGKLFGREIPLARLAAAFEATATGARQLVFVTGEAGIGKSALVASFLAQIENRSDVLICAGQCVEGYGGSREPFYAVFEAFAALCKGPFGTAATRALLQYAPTWALQMPGQIQPALRERVQHQLISSSRDRMLREACELLESLAADRSLVLLLEDIHCADFATLDLLGALLRRRKRARVLIMATYRTEELRDAAHPLYELSQDLLMRKFATEVTLAPLSVAAVAEYLAANTPVVDSALAARLQSHSGGNPLFLRATLEHLAEQGRLVAAATEFEIPDTLARLIEVRFARLSSDQQRALEAGSVAGVSFNAAVASLAANLEVAAFESVCDELARRRFFIAIRADGLHPTPANARTYSFNHVLYRRVLYSRQGPSRLALQHRKIAERLEQLFSAAADESHVGELAEHFTLAAEWSRASHYWRLALRTALRRFAYRDALVILDQASAVALRLPRAARVQAQLEFLDRRASIFGSSHDPRAVEAYTALVREAAEAGDVQSEVRGLLGLAYVRSWRDLPGSMEALEIALLRSAELADPLERDVARIHICVRRIWVSGWNPDDARQCEAAVRCITARGDNFAAARSLINFSMLCIISTRYREAHDSFHDNYRLLLDNPEHLTDPEIARAIWMYHLGTPWSLTFLGDLGGSLRENTAAIETFERNGDQPSACALNIYRCVLLYFAMDFEAVLQAGQSEFAHILPIEQRIAQIFCALASLELGAAEQAGKYIAAADAAMRQQSVHLDWYWVLPLHWAAARLLLDSGDLDGAQRRVELFIDQAHQSDERMWQALAWDTHARLALARQDVMAAKESIHRALEVTSGFETPNSDWRVHRTAAVVCGQLGDEAGVLTHTRTGEAVRRVLHDSLPEGSRGRARLLQH